MAKKPVRVVVEDTTVDLVVNVAEDMAVVVAEDMAAKLEYLHRQQEHEEPDSLLFTCAAKYGLIIPFIAYTSAVDLFYSYFTEDFWAAGH